MYLDQRGQVRACCQNDFHLLGNVTQQRLVDIWRGERAQALRRALAAHDLDLGCDFCEWQVAKGRPDLAFARWFDEFPVTSDEPDWPQQLELAVSNTCNLQCVMCDGDLSSSIRLHRERRPPLPRVYGEEFFADVVPFVDALEDASFTGGEPFLGAENHRIWDLLIERNPGVKHTVTTNGTRWDRRVEAVLDGLRTWVNVSVDGFSAATYEGVRVGADRDAVFANIERFAAYAARAGTEVRIFHCLMPQNHHELGDLLLWAEDRGFPVTIHVVEDPDECCLERLPDDQWDAVRASLLAQGERVLPRLDRNAAALREQLERVEHATLRPALGADAGLSTAERRR